ncbi:hypothetical protein ACHAWF_018006 [Thalassiosira exigua]
MVRYSGAALKATLVCSTFLPLGVGWMGACTGQATVAIFGFGVFAVAYVYARMAWARIPFTSVNLSLAIAAVRANMGLFPGNVCAIACGYVWAVVALVAAASGHRVVGNWALVYSLFSYYWTQQVLTNFVAAMTAGVVGRWCVAGEHTPTYRAGMREVVARTRTYSLGSICFGSLFCGVVRALRGLGSFLRSKDVPRAPSYVDWLLGKIRDAVDEVNEWAFVYVGLYGYSYTEAARNVMLLFHNKALDGIVTHHLAGNIVMMANVAIGMVTGFVGSVFYAFDHQNMFNNGAGNPTTEGFLVGFFVGHFMSSIMLSLVTASMNTLTVCLAESSEEFKAHHPALSRTLVDAWKNDRRCAKKLRRENGDLRACLNESGVQPAPRETCADESTLSNYIVELQKENECLRNQLERSEGW